MYYMKTLTRKASSERREEIVAAVLQIIGEQGLTSLTTTRIAQEIGVSSGAIFRHFASLEEILSEAVRRAVLALETTFPKASLPPKQRLFALARARVELLAANRGLAWMLLSEQATLTLPAEAVAELGRVAKRSKLFFLDALREGAEDGSIRSDIAPEVLLVPLMGTVHSLTRTRGVYRKAKTRSQPDQVLEALEILFSVP